MVHEVYVSLLLEIGCLFNSCSNSLSHVDNYIVAGALDGGTQVISFILNLAVFGAVGNAHAFPDWWGNDLSQYLFYFVPKSVVNSYLISADSSIRI